MRQLHRTRIKPSNNTYCQRFSLFQLWRQRTQLAPRRGAVAKLAVLPKFLAEFVEIHVDSCMAHRAGRSRRQRPGEKKAAAIVVDQQVGRVVVVRGLTERSEKSRNKRPILPRIGRNSAESVV